MADGPAILYRLDPRQQPVSRPPGDSHAEILGAAAQDSNQIISRLPGEIAGQLDRQARQCRSTAPAAGLADRRLRRLLTSPCGLKRFQALPQLCRRYRAIPLKRVAGLVENGRQLPRLVFSVGPLRDVSVVGHVVSYDSLIVSLRQRPALFLSGWPPGRF
jgi:hypothetical protein